MRKLYSTFPGGTPGVGLLILRITSVIGCIVWGGTLLGREAAFGGNQLLYFAHLILPLALIFGSVFLILGVWMPFVSTFLTLDVFATMFVEKVDNNIVGCFPALLLAGIIIALFFLGPGAYSVDAQLYGRKLIFIPSSKKENGKKS